MSAADQSLSLPRASARTELVLYLREGILGASWPDGARDAFPTRRVSEMIAAHVAAGPLRLVVLKPEEAAFLADMVQTWYGGDQDESMRSLVARLRGEL